MARRGKRRARMFLPIVLACVLLPAGAATAAGGPTIMLTRACHMDTPYGFSVGLSGFPANTGFQANLSYQGQDHFYGFSTDANGGVPAIGFGSFTPLGLIRVTVTLVNTGQRYTASLNDPCDPPLPLAAAMCGDGFFTKYAFPTARDCYGYVSRLINGQAVPVLILTPECSGSTLVGFTGLIRGLSPSIGAYTATITSDSGSFQFGLSGADRFGVAGPDGLGTGPTSQITVAITGSGLNLSRTLTTASCG